MQNPDVSGIFPDSPKVNLLTELFDRLIQLYHLILSVVYQFETQEVGVHELILADVIIHQA